MAQLEALVTERTRIVALSHVQFTSGFAADLAGLGAFCRERGIDLVVDVAQSLGCLPVYPEEWGVSAVAASGWKWLLGPLGCGLLYTSAAFREKLTPVVVGADIVTQGLDYLDHTWRPHRDGRLFEYSTCQESYALALTCCLRDLFLAASPEAVRAEVFRLQDGFLAALDTERFRPVRFLERHRSGILALAPAGDPPERLEAGLRRSGVVTTVRGGYLRIAPHFYNDDTEMVRAAETLNAL
jgi:selenocysteine lyase/cysteine desulfurase